MKNKLKEQIEHKKFQNDQEKKIVDNVYWVAKEYIEMNETMSVREIGKVLNTNYN